MPSINALNQAFATMLAISQTVSAAPRPKAAGCLPTQRSCGSSTFSGIYCFDQSTFGNCVNGCAIPQAVAAGTWCQPGGNILALGQGNGAPPASSLSSQAVPTSSSSTPAPPASSSFTPALASPLTVSTTPMPAPPVSYVPDPAPVPSASSAPVPSPPASLAPVQSSLSALPSSSSSTLLPSSSSTPPPSSSSTPSPPSSSTPPPTPSPTPFPLISSSSSPPSTPYSPSPPSSPSSSSSPPPALSSSSTAAPTGLQVIPVTTSTSSPTPSPSAVVPEVLRVTLYEQANYGGGTYNFVGVASDKTMPCRPISTSLIGTPMSVKPINGWSCGLYTSNDCSGTKITVTDTGVQDFGMSLSGSNKPRSIDCAQT